MSTRRIFAVLAVLAFSMAVVTGCDDNGGRTATLADNHEFCAAVVGHNSGHNSGHNDDHAGLHCGDRVLRARREGGRGPPIR